MYKIPPRILIYVISILTYLHAFSAFTCNFLSYSIRFSLTCRKDSPHINTLGLKMSSGTQSFSCSRSLPKLSGSGVPFTTTSGDLCQ